MQPQFTPVPPRIKDLTGQRFGRLLVISYVDKISGKHRWLCKCDCGQETTAYGKYLNNGEKRSCGCLHKEQLQERNRTHDLSRHSLYGRWAAMITRCTNPASLPYKSYGGRGIRVCDDWIHSFPNYLEHVSSLPHFGEKGYSLDRIDNDANYEPGNVRWATRKEQRRNNSKFKLITFREKEQCLSDWAKELGFPLHILITRIFSSGWDIERAFTTPVAKDAGGHSSRLTVSDHTKNTTSQDQPDPSA